VAEGGGAGARQAETQQTHGEIWVAGAVDAGGGGGECAGGDGELVWFAFGGHA
jgi:hypothetical protein